MVWTSNRKPCAGKNPRKTEVLDV